MSVQKFNRAEIQRKAERDPDNFVKIDGIKITGLQDIKIEYGINEPFPIITMKFLAKELTANVEGETRHK